MLSEGRPTKGHLQADGYRTQNITCEEIGHPYTPHQKFPFKAHQLVAAAIDLPRASRRHTCLDHVMDGIEHRGNNEVRPPETRDSICWRVSECIVAQR